MSSRKLHRGPRPLPGTPETTEPGRRVCYPELLGMVLQLARKRALVEQQQVSRWLRLPVSTVSNLERGTVTATVYYLDAYAAALNEFGRNVTFDSTPPWLGWQFHQIASVIAERLEGRWEHVIVWSIPPPPEEQHLFTSGLDLLALVREACPEDQLHRM